MHPGNGAAGRSTAWLVALSLTIAAAAAGARWVHARQVPQDLQMICAAGEALGAGANPYEPSVLQLRGVPAHLPLTFPPLVVRVMRPACGAPAGVAALAALLIVIAIISLGLRVPWRIALVSAAAGFAAFPWVAVTGNPAMLEAIAVAAAAAALARNKPIVFACAIGAAAFAKSLMPLLFLLAAVRWPRRIALRVAGGAILCVAALHALDWMISPQASASYWLAYRDLYGGYVAADMAFGSEYNPSVFTFAPIVTERVGLGRFAGLLLAAGVAAGFFAAWVRLWSRFGRDVEWRAGLSLMLIATIIVAHPRFKPYSAFAAAPVLAFALAGIGARRRPAVLVASCVVPGVALLLLALLGWMPPLPAPLVFALQYAQWLCLAVLVAIGLRPGVFGAFGRGVGREAG